MPLFQRHPIRQISSHLASKRATVNFRSSPHHLRTMVTASQLQALQDYTACDISDALLKLKVPNCGFLPDLKPITNLSPSSSISIFPASTVLFAPKNAAEKELVEYGEPNIPSGTHWVDHTIPGSIVVISQPKGQICAVLGGIMALRMSVIGAEGVIAWGRVRDVEELKETGLPIWAKGTSITGTGAQASPHAIQIPLDLDGTIVSPGDLVFSDAVNGVIVIPKEKVADVVEMLPKLIEADERVKEDVKKGMTVKEAFKKHRG